MPIKKHYLKILIQYYKDVLMLKKRFEVRKNDRDFKEGEYLILMPINKDGKVIKGLPFVTFQIIYILNGGQFGIEPGYCVMSINYVDGLEVDSHEIINILTRINEIINQDIAA